eukprot:284824_1
MPHLSYIVVVAVLYAFKYGNAQTITAIMKLPDSAFSASSVMDYWKCATKQAKWATSTSGETYGWCPSTANGNQWLQIDMGSTWEFSMIGTQHGYATDAIGGGWVTSYRLKYKAYEDEPWTTFGTLTGPTMVDGRLTTPVWHDEVAGIIARYLRVEPLAWSNYPIMRVEAWAKQVAAPPIGPTTAVPTHKPTKRPSNHPTPAPTVSPSTAPTAPPSSAPSAFPTASPSAAPSAPPTLAPTLFPTSSPSAAPTSPPSSAPTAAPTTMHPSQNPSADPTTTARPTSAPTYPTPLPTTNPIHSGSWSSWVQSRGSGSYTKRLETYDHSHITELCVQSGALVDAIKVRWRNGDWSAYAGGGGRPGESCYALADPDDCFGDIAIYRGDAIDAIAFRTVNNWTPKYGGGGGSVKLIYAQDTCLKALNVEYGSVLVGIQAYYEEWTPFRLSTAPSVAPTNRPTASTDAPSVAPIPPPTTASLSPSGAPALPPSVSPSESPTTETSFPTAPSASPTGQPTTPSPSSQPIGSPTATPITPSPIQPTSAPLNNLHFVLRYKDKSWATWYSFRFAKEDDYVDIMKNALDGAFEATYGHSIMYSQGDEWERKGWTRAGMSNVDFCRFSDVVLSDDCPSYEAQGQEYVAIAVFDADADEAVVEYVQYLRHSVRDEKFEDAFGEQMNEL